MKKMVKAIALALALCMVLSVSAFAATPGTATGDTATQTVTVRVELEDTTSTEQVALLIVDTAVEDSSAGIADVAENQIYFIDQTAATAGVATFTAPIAADVNTVDVYVGSSSLSTNGAVLLGDDIDIRVSKNITIAAGEETAVKKILNVDVENGITRPGAAIKVTVTGLGIQQMIWALEGSLGRVFSKPIVLNYDTAAVEGDVWFTGVFGVDAIAEKVGEEITDVDAIFLASDNNDYFTEPTDETLETGYVAPTN